LSVGKFFTVLTEFRRNTGEKPLCSAPKPSQQPRGSVRGSLIGVRCCRGNVAGTPRRRAQRNPALPPTRGHPSPGDQHPPVSRGRHAHRAAGRSWVAGCRRTVCRAACVQPERIVGCSLGISQCSCPPLVLMLQRSIRQRQHERLESRITRCGFGCTEGTKSTIIAFCFVHPPAAFRRGAQKKGAAPGLSCIAGSEYSDRRFPRWTTLVACWDSACAFYSRPPVSA